MKRSLGLCAIVLGVLVLLPLGCHGPGRSPESTVESALSAVKDGDRAALEATFMPGSIPPSNANPSFEQLSQMMDQKSLQGISWQVTAKKVRSSSGTLVEVDVEFSAPVTIGAWKLEPHGIAGKTLMAAVARDTADERDIMLGRSKPAGIPGPTGRWVMVASGLID